MRNIIIFITLLVSVLLMVLSCEDQDDRVRDLKGRWLFSVGDDREWAEPGFDDSSWDKIYVPRSWENQGYNDYNGFAWYRRHFRVPRKYSNINLYLYLGHIDDVDEVYVNGRLVGSTGTFPPDFVTAYNIQRKYHIPADLINFSGDNTIAVRVYDHHQGGGIMHGRIGLYRHDVIPPDLELSGKWKFNTGDSLVWVEPDYSDSVWNEIMVPAFWEDQGYEGYDGFAWYRRTFDLPADLLDQRLVFMLGKIDDADEVYINGMLAGSTAKLDEATGNDNWQRYYGEFRGYYIPESVPLKASGNVISVRVYDSGGMGGIYEGPIGIITHGKYLDYWRYKSNRRNNR